MKQLSNMRGRVNTALMIMALLAFSAALFYGVRMALAWAVPDVAITSPSDGVAVGGNSSPESRPRHAIAACISACLAL